MILNPTFGKGTTFTPQVSQNGDLSWTNGGGLPNPKTVNIRGPAGPSFTNMDVITLRFEGTYTNASADLPRPAKLVVALYNELVCFTIPSKTGFAWNKKYIISMNADGTRVVGQRPYTSSPAEYPVIAFS